MTMAMQQWLNDLAGYLRSEQSFADCQSYIYDMSSEDIDFRSAVEQFLAQKAGTDQLYIHQGNERIGYPFDDDVAFLPYPWTLALETWIDEDAKEEVSVNRIIEILEFCQFCQTHNVSEEVIDIVQSFYCRKQ